MDVSLTLWLATLGLILLMLAIDLFAHRHASVISIKEAALWSTLWVSLGVAFGIYLWLDFGPEIGQQYFSGFVIEKSLAVDNVFIWALIFAAFSVPREYQHRVLFLGVIGALVFRGIFIAAGAALIKSFGWVLYLFAAFLIYTGVKMLLERDKHFNPAESKFLKLFQKIVPTTDRYYGQRLFVRKAGVLMATPLLAVLALVEFTDIIFAVDSIPAIFAVTEEPFIVFAANAFALLGLRAMYFLLSDLIHRFVYLKVGLSFILVWVGIKLALHDVVKIPTLLSLSLIIAIISIAIIASLIKTKGQAAHPAEVEPKFAFGSATEEEIAQLDEQNGRKSK
ncbi:TerC family protein [Aquiluna borgnonia]|uniref:TerC family protein n=1 Tax=Aquiluna borgnonia TaxID=2499157 RepID=A0A7D4TL53_9MICO|nr:TerC family protein [Aquiluna borgnonia]QKJ25872.1 TerC family protein [Aquiluna borgnonia]